MSTSQSSATFLAAEGWRYVGKQQGLRNKEATAKRTGLRGNDYRPLVGIAFVHTVIDDHSRVVYAEICSDEKTATPIAVLNRAVTWFAEQGVTVERVLSDNGSCYRSYVWRDACADLGIVHNEPGPTDPDEREDRAIPSKPGRRLGLRPAL